jgi:predicted GNAT family acetyltransferase
MDSANLEVRHNPERSRFEIQLGEDLALAEYMLAGSNIIFTHTEVPPAFEGQGIGSQLAKFALDYAVKQGYKIQPLCPFIAAYVRRNSAYQPHVWHT